MGTANNITAHPLSQNLIPSTKTKKKITQSWLEKKTSGK